MDIFQQLIDSVGFTRLGWQNFVMFAVGGTLIFLAVRHRFEPLLLIPIGFGAILANLPLAELSASSQPKFESPRLTANDFVQLDRLVNRLKAAADPVSADLAKRLPLELRRRLASPDPASGDDLELRRALASALNELIEGASLYDAERFREVRLRPETAAFLKSPPKDVDATAVLNRLLIEDAFRHELARIGPEEGAKWPLLAFIYSIAIKHAELLPPIIFMGVGALTDFRPLLGRPITFLLGAAAQLGIFLAALGASYLAGFSVREAAAIGIIGGADGPTTIFVASKLAPHLLGAVAVAAYSYMALVPLIQPPIIRMLTTPEEREIDMPQAKPVSRSAVVLFPIVTAVVVILVVPASGPLIGMLMFGNLLKESGVTERLASTAGGPLINIVTIFLGLVVGATMNGVTFLTEKTLAILALGMVAFSCSTMGGIIFAKLLNLILPAKSRINPCIGAAGVSAVPMAARVVQTYVSGATGGRVNPLMAAMGPNVAGVVGSTVAAGVFLALLN